MKYILSILLVLSIKSFGQDSAINISTGKLIKLPNYLPNINNYDDQVYRTNINTYIFDTVQCIILYSDSNNVLHSENILEIRKQECCIDGNTGNLAYYKPRPYFTHFGYLNKDKTELPKNITVWLSKNNQ